MRRFFKFGRKKSRATGPKRKNTKRPAQRSRFARVEPLEARHMLAVVAVDGTTDVNDGDTSSITALLADHGADGKISLREAIVATNNTASADTIVFDPLVFDSQKTITLSGSQLTISDDLTIEGPGAELLAISGDDSSRVFNIQSGTTATLSGLTITGGHAVSAHGAGIYNRGDLTLEEVVVYDNHADRYAGGIYFTTGTLTLINSTVDANSAGWSGGGIYVNTAGDAALTMLGSTISNNDTTAAGGGLLIWGGGAGVTTDGDVWIVNSTFSGNTAATWGGGTRVAYQDRTRSTSSTRRSTTTMQGATAAASAASRRPS